MKKVNETHGQLSINFGKKPRGSASEELQRRISMLLFTRDLETALKNNLTLNQFTNKIIGTFLESENRKIYDIKKAVVFNIHYLRKFDWFTYKENNELVDVIMDLKPEFNEIRTTMSMQSSTRVLDVEDDLELRTDIQKNIPGATGRRNKARDYSKLETMVASCQTWQYNRFTDSVKAMPAAERKKLFVDLVKEYIIYYNKKHNTNFELNQSNEKKILINGIRTK